MPDPTGQYPRMETIHPAAMLRPAGAPVELKCEVISNEPARILRIRFPVQKIRDNFVELQSIVIAADGTTKVKLIRMSYEEVQKIARMIDV